MDSCHSPLDEVPVSPADADEALVGLGGHEAGQALDLGGVGAEHGDRAQAGGLRHHEAAPARPDVDLVLHHPQRRHLALPGAELVVNVDRDQGLAAGDQLATVQLVHEALGLNLPV